MTDDNKLLRARDLLNQALDLRKERRYAEALEKCEAALGLDPGAQRPRLLYDKVSKLKAAFDLLQQAPGVRASAETLTCLREALAQTLLQDELDMADVVQEERRLLQQGLLEAQKAWAHAMSQEAIRTYKEAKGATRVQAFQEAEAMLRQALELDPDSRATVEANLAAIHKELAPLQEADEFVALGQEALGARDYETALRHFEAALARNPFHQPAARGQDEARDRLDVQRELQRGEAALAQNQPAEALQHFEMARSLARRYTDLQQSANERLYEAQKQVQAQGGYAGATARAKEAMEAGDFEAAAQHFGEALSHRPGDPVALAGQRSAQSQGQQLAEMLSYVQRALAEQPPNFGTAKLYSREALARFSQNPQVQELWLNTLLRSARELLKRGSYAEAMAESDSILQRLPNHADAVALRKEAEDRQRAAALRNKGQEAFKEGDFDQAEAYLVEALQCVEAYADLRDELQVQLRHVQKAAEVGNKVKFFTTQAKRAREKQQWDEVIGHCEQAIEWASRSGVQATEVDGWLDEARQHRSEVATSLRLGREALAQGQHEQAITVLRPAQQVWPAHEQVIQTLGQAYVFWGEDLLRRGEWTQASEAFDQALKLAPQQEAALRGQQAAQDLPYIRRTKEQAQQLLVAGRPDEALRALQEAVPKAQPYVDEEKELARLLEQAEAAAGALVRFQEASRLASQAHQRGQLTEVVRWLEEALRHKPGDAETTQLLDQARRERDALAHSLGQGQAMLAEAQRACDEGRDDEARTALAQAATQFDAALQLAPQNQDALTGQNQIAALGSILSLLAQAADQRKSENLDAAVATLEEALRQHPDHPRLPPLIKEYTTERDQQRQARAAVRRKQADEAWNAGRHILARDLYAQVWQLVGDLEARDRADQVNAHEELIRSVEQKVADSEAKLKNASYGPAVESLQQALDLLLSKGEVDVETAALVRQASAGDLVDQLNAEKTHNAAWDKMKEIMNQAQRAGRERRDTAFVLEVASNLLEARRRRALLGQVESAKVAEDLTSAVHNAERALNLDPGNETLVTIYREALQALRTAQDNRAQRRIDVATKALAEGNYSEATRQLAEASKLSHISEGVKEEAERLLGQAEGLKQIAERVTPFIEAAINYMDNGEYDKAIIELQKAEREDSEKKARLEAARVQALLEQARQRRRDILEGEVAAILNDARPRLVTPRNEAAVDDTISKLREALGKVPDHTEARELLQAAQAKKNSFVQLAKLKEKATQALEVGNVAVAVALLEEAKTLDVADADVTALLSQARQRKEAADNAQRLLEEGRAAVENSDYAKAVERLSALYGLDPANQAVADLLHQAQAGQILQEAQSSLQAEQFENAATAYRRVLELDPQNRKAQDGLQEAKNRAEAQCQITALLGQAEAALGIDNCERALTLLDQLLGKAPQHPQALQLKEQAEAKQHTINTIEELLRTAQQMRQAGRLDEAIDKCDQVLMLQSSNTAAISLKDQVLAVRDRDKCVADALASARQALDDQEYERARIQADRLRELASQYKELDGLYERIRAGQAKMNRWLEQLNVAGVSVDFADPGQLGDTIRTLEELQRTAPPRQGAQAETLLKKARQRQAAAQRISSLVSQARNQEKAGDLTKALAALNDILAIDNAHFEATQLKAELEQRLDRLNKADKLLGQAQQFLTAGDYGRAREQCGQALALAPAHAAGLKLRTEIETAQRRSAGAVSFLAQARAALKALRPTDLPEQALKFIAQAIELEPTSEEGLKLRQEALEHQERANKLREHLRVGRQALQDRHYEDALVAFEQALAYDRANEEIRSLRDRSREARDRQAEVEKWVRQGQAHLNAARYAEAADAFGKALVQGPDDEAQVLTLLAKAREGARNEQVHSLLQQASSEIESGNDEAAGKALAALKALAPNDPDLMKLEPFVDLIRRGQAAHGAGQYAQALEAYGQASKLWPASRRLANLIAQTRGAAGLVDRLLSAQAHLEARRYSEAIADVQSILALDPRYPQAQELAQGIVAQLLEEARNAHARGEYRSALAFCAQALDVGVDNEKARTLQQTIASEAANQVVGSVVTAEKALQEGDLATADQAITRGLRIEPEHKRLLALLNTLRERERVRREADMLVEHGREALHARDYSAAQASFAEAVRADGRHREAPRWHQFALWLAEGIAIFKQERYAEAASRFGQAVALFAESTNAPPELAEAQRLKKEATECDGIIGQMTQLLAEADRLRQERNYLAAREALTKLLTLRFPGDVAQSAAGGE